MWSLLAPLACAVSPAAAPDSGAEHYLLKGATVVGLGLADVEIEGGKIVAVGPSAQAGEVIDLGGRFLVPAFIDSHVHLAYDPRGEQMADGGVAAAVDLAAPSSFLAADHAPLRVIASGPMVTAVGGYPTRSWGIGGYGMECATGADAEAAVDALVAAGAGVIKLPVTTEPQLDDEALAQAAARAHARGVKVVSHALGDGEASRAATAGADVLAHTPTAALSAATIQQWSGRAVISTLLAFGGGGSAVANLAALRAGGATVLYGTDFGNTRTAGIDAGELSLLVESGMDAAAVIASGTSVPAAFWGFSDLGEIAAGKDASLLVLPRDPLVDPLALAEAEQVWTGGVRR